MSDLSPGTTAENPALERVARALDALDGFDALACDGAGHPIPDAQACLHVRCTLSSPRREEALGRLGPLVRRGGFVMAALVDRRDLYSISWTAGRRGTLEEACDKLSGLLADPAALASGHVPDRRGR